MKKSIRILTLLFLAVLGIRLYLAFQAATFTGDEAYFTLRQVEHIRETGLPLYDDPLSYGGKVYVFKPFFQYFLTLFNLFLPLAIVGKLIPNILASSLVIAVYLVSKELTNQDQAALFSAFISGFIPVFMAGTTNTLSSASMVVPLLLFAIYCFLTIKQERRIYLFITIFLILAFTNSVYVVFLASLPIYLLFLKLERLPISKQEVEISAFSIFTALWIEFVLFKKYFLVHGPSVIWQNIPSQILQLYFNDITAFDVLSGIGFIPVTYGAYSVFEHIHHVKDKRAYLVISFSFAAGLLLWLKLIRPETGLMCLGAAMAVLFSLLYTKTFGYLQKTRLNKYSGVFIALFVLAFTASSILPSLTATTASVNGALRQSELDALTWLEKYSEPGETVLALPTEGHTITMLAKRKNVMDTNYLNTPNIGQRYTDVMGVFLARFETEALEPLSTYDVDYVYYSRNARAALDLREPRYIRDEKCFRKIYDKYVRIYEVLCKI